MKNPASKKKPAGFLAQSFVEFAFLLDRPLGLCYTEYTEQGETPITKKRSPSVYGKGATPIEKNVYVVDEQGNEYEATYPKRAKGLVKKGRARFIAENKICLACPPDQILEEQTMENTNTVTVKEIFDQIVALQKDMIGNSGAALYRMGDVLSSVFGDNTNVAECENLEAIVDTVCHPFSLREQTYQQMLDLYEKMYNDCKNGVQ